MSEGSVTVKWSPGVVALCVQKENNDSDEYDVIIPMEIGQARQLQLLLAKSIVKAHHASDPHT